MATSTLIQKLDATAFESSKTVPGSYTAVTTPDVSNRRQVETFIAGATVIPGDWMQFDTSATGAARVLTVIQATAVATGNPLVCGVLLGSAETDGSLTVGSKVNVVVGGYVEGVNVDGAVVAGSPLTVDAIAGSANVAVAADVAICGVALEADVANKAACWVYKQF